VPFLLKKEQQKSKCCSFKKGIAEQANAVPFEKGTTKNQECCSF